LARVLILANVDAHSSNPASSKEAVSHADSNQGQPGKASRNAAPFNLTIVSPFDSAQPSPPCSVASRFLCHGGKRLCLGDLCAPLERVV
jgi:hypothetical protein